MFLVIFSASSFSSFLSPLLLVICSSAPFYSSLLSRASFPLRLYFLLAFFFVGYCYCYCFLFFSFFSQPTQCRNLSEICWHLLAQRKRDQSVERRREGRLYRSSSGLTFTFALLSNKSIPPKPVQGDWQTPTAKTIRSITPRGNIPTFFTSLSLSPV